MSITRRPAESPARWTALLLFAMSACGNEPAQQPAPAPAVVQDSACCGEARSIARSVPGAPCASDGRPPGVFVDAAEALGIDFASDPSAGPGAELRDWSGVGIGDLDGDNHLDLYLTNGGGPDRLYLTGGRGPTSFEGRDRTEGEQWARAVTLVDIDGDGDLDAAISGHWAYLLLNDGTGHFTDMGRFPPHLAQPEREFIVYGAAAGDVDGDGPLDLYMGVHLEAGGDFVFWPGAEWLLRNSGDGSFTDMSQWLPQPRVEDRTFLVSLVDLDDDGDLDLYETNDAWSLADAGIDITDTEKQGNRLFRNDLFQSKGAGALVDVTDASGAGVEVSGMGAALGDYDNDGLIDVYVTSMLPQNNVLLHNDGDLTLHVSTFDVDAFTLYDDHDVAWGAVFLDADADGWQDLYVTHGWHTDDFSIGLPANELEQPNVLLKNQSGAHFVDISGQAGVDGALWSRSPAVGDLNEDGFADLVVGNANGRPYVYLNGCDDRPWLSVRLKAPPPNTHAVGARVRVKSASLEQTRQILPGSDGLYSSSAPEATFGLPAGTTSVDLEVRWPDGAVTRHPGLTARRRVEVERLP